MADQQTDRELDIVVYGATGFVGALTARHLAEHAPNDARIGLAGRSADKLAKVRATLPPRARDWPLIVADSSDDASLQALVGRTKVVASTVGPYARHGLPLVRACAAAGTHYADLTGEVLFVRESADECHDAARTSGARIVHSCGFDSVPSDLGVHMAYERAAADDAGELTETVYVLLSARGGVSGGTIDSVRNQVVEMTADSAKRKIVTDPYALSPDRDLEPEGSSDSFLPGRDPLLKRWVAPFVMATYNTRIVRRSNALLGYAYGKGFRYREVQGVGTSPAAPLFAGAVAGGVGLMAAGMALPPTRFVLDRVLPKPGEGPSQKQQQNGSFHVEVHARTTSGATYVSTVKAKGDPGYAATAVMLGQSVLSLALDDLPGGGGVLTPASAMGEALERRLRIAGFTMSVERR